MNTYMTRLDGFKKSLHPCALDESSLSIERVKLSKSLDCIAFYIFSKVSRASFYADFVKYGNFIISMVLSMEVSVILNTQRHLYYLKIMDTEAKPVFPLLSGNVEF